MGNKNTLASQSSCQIRALFAYASKRKEEIGEDNVFDFSIGSPSSPLPEKAKETIVEILNDTNPVKLHGYSSLVSGDMSVRKVIAQDLENRFGVDVDPELMFLTCGASAAISGVFTALLEKGDELICFKPYFPEYKAYLRNTEAKFVEVEPDLKTFEPDLKDFENKINRNTKAVLYNSPNNPTGVLYSDATLKKMGEILEKKEKEYAHPIYLISDEPYRELLFDNESYPFLFKYYDHSIVCYSYSKSLSIPGERIGYCLFNKKIENVKDLFDKFGEALRMMGYDCAPTLFQELVKRCTGLYSDFSFYKENRDCLHQELSKIGYQIIPPQGAFYIFMKALGEDAPSFVERAKKHELIMVPSDTIGVHVYVRIAYCVDPKKVKRSIEAFKKLYEEYRGE